MQSQDFSDYTDDNCINENFKRLSSGVVLLARDILKDPNFDSTAVLICIHSDDGSYGLVLNRGSHMPLSEIFDGFRGTDSKREIYIGGPVKQEELQVLQVTDTPVEDAFEVYPGVFLGGKWEGIGHMIETDPETTRLFLGYSGWGADQLGQEILAGAWDVYRIDLKKLLLDPDKNLKIDAQSISMYLESS